MTSKKNKNILCIETTSKIAGVTVASNNKTLVTSDLDLGLTHSVTLFTNIINVLKKARLKINNIKLIKVSSGPGSFTGIRIGIACALGLSEANDIKIEYIDTLDSLTYNIDSKYHDFILSMIDAKANRVYFSLYNKKHKKIINDSIIDIKNLFNLLNKYFKDKNCSFILVGDACISYINYILANLKIKYYISIENINLPKSSSLIYCKGIISKCPAINYLLASKAERDRNV